MTKKEPVTESSISTECESILDFYSDTEWGQPESYDMMLSSSRFGIDGCVSLIIDCLKEKEASGNE